MQIFFMTKSEFLRRLRPSKPISTEINRLVAMICNDLLSYSLEWELFLEPMDYSLI